MIYQVTLIQTVTSSAVIEVDARDEDDAEKQAEKLSAGLEWIVDSETIEVDTIEEAE